MIRTFADRETEALFRDQAVPRFAAVERAARRRLLALHRARTLRDLLAIPQGGLDPAAGERPGERALAVSGRWLIRFRWEEGGADRVRLTAGR